VRLGYDKGAIMVTSLETSSHTAAQLQLLAQLSSTKVLILPGTRRDYDCGTTVTSPETAESIHVDVDVSRNNAAQSRTAPQAVLPTKQPSSSSEKQQNKSRSKTLLIRILRLKEFMKLSSISGQQRPQQSLQRLKAVQSGTQLKLKRKQEQLRCQKQLSSIPAKYHTYSDTLALYGHRQDQQQRHALHTLAVLPRPRPWKNCKSKVNVNINTVSICIR
jgi:hypothetical protein